MSTRNRPLPSMAVVAALAIALGSASAGEPTTGDPTAMERFLARPLAPRQYRAVRHLEASGGGQRGWLDARTEFDPGTGLRFEVVAEGGSGYIRSRVLRPLLQQEQDLIASGRTDSVALNRSNYEFSSAGEAQPGLVRVTVRPLRKDRALIAGELLLASPAGDLVRAQGRLAKNPSFWTRRVDVVRHYARINDVVVPVSLESEAELRLFGRSSLRMVYEYSEIDYRAIGPVIGADRDQ